MTISVKRVLGLLIALGTVVLDCSAQNMVFNGGFEVYRGEVPCGYVSEPNQFTLSNWYVPTRTTPDIYAAFVARTCLSLAARGAGAGVLPRSGQSMVGIFTYGKSAGSGEWREYIQTELKFPMLPGSDYLVEAWFCLKPSSYLASNNIGIYFSTYRPTGRDYAMLEKVPQVESREVWRERGKWVRLRDTIRADKPYRWLTIGSFRKDAENESVELSAPNESPLDILYGLSGRAYYFVDDVKVIPLDKKQADFLREQEEEYAYITMVNFPHDSYALTQEMRDRLEKLYRHLQRLPHARLMLSGHTDSVGLEGYNVTLSEMRTESVRNYLRGLSFPENRMEREWFGPHRPAASNLTPEGRYLNRRVTMEIIR
jgi:outer membrane protein OmpA-like peptidoglycan-associated protein